MPTKIVYRAVLFLAIAMVGLVGYHFAQLGGLRAGQFVANAQPQPPSNERVFPAAFETVFQATLSVLQDNQEPVVLADRTRGLINTGSIAATNQRLRQIVTDNILQFLEQQTGRYLLTFQIESVTPASTRVRVTPLILSENPAMANPFGGQSLTSNGILEREHLDAIGRKIIG